MAEKPQIIPGVEPTIDPYGPAAPDLRSLYGKQSDPKAARIPESPEEMATLAQSKKAVEKGTEEMTFTELRDLTAGRSNLNRAMQDKPELADVYKKDPTVLNIIHDAVQAVGGWVGDPTVVVEAAVEGYDTSTLGKERYEWMKDALANGVANEEWGSDIANRQAVLEKDKKDNNTVFGSGAEMAGMFAGAVTDPRNIEMIYTGTSLSALAGATAGTVAAPGPGTAIGGFSAGLAALGYTTLWAGPAASFGRIEAADMFQVLHSDMGVPVDKAGYVAEAAGIAVSALELLGLYSLAIKPVKKEVTREALERLKDSSIFKLMMKDGFKRYGTMLGEQQVIEITQEIASYSLEVFGSKFSETGKEKEWSTEELIDNLVQVMEKTLQASLLLGAGPTGAGTAITTKKGMDAKKNAKAIIDMAEAIENSQLDNTVLSEAAADQLKMRGIEKVYIDAAQLKAWVDLYPEGASIYEMLGIWDNGDGSAMQWLDSQIMVGNDITISVDVFSHLITQNKNFEELIEHIRLNDDALSKAQAELYRETALDEVTVALEEIAHQQAMQDKHPNIVVAEAELGLNILMDETQLAGMSKKEARIYLENKEKARDDAVLYSMEKEQQRIADALTDAYQQARAEIELKVREDLSALPAYRSLNGLNLERPGGTLPRLDRKAVETIAVSLGIELRDLPKAHGRVIYTTTKAEQGMDPDLYADLYGYEDSVEMFEDILSTPLFEEAVQVETNRLMDQTESSTIDKMREAQEAVERLANTDRVAMVMSAYQNAAKQAGRKSVTRKAVRNMATVQLAGKPVIDLNHNLMVNAAGRAGRAAAKAVKEGNMQEAAKQRLIQAVQLEMLRQYFVANKQVGKQIKELRKFATKGGTRGLSDGTRTAIEEAMSTLEWGPRTRKGLEKGKHGPPPPPIQLAPGHHFITDLNAKQINVLYQDIMSLVKRDREYQSLYAEADKYNTDRTARKLADQILRALGGKKPRSKLDPTSVKTPLWRVLPAYLLSADGLLLELDGWDHTGTVYQQLKGRYDLAMSQGYMEGQVGYYRRVAEEADKRTAILRNYYTKRELDHISVKKLRIPGVKRQVTHATLISILLHSGNAHNKEALEESGHYTPEEIALIRDFADKRDWDFAQDMWNYFKGFEVEAGTALQRRTGQHFEIVKGEPIKTRHGTYTGGYMPLRWDGDATNYFDPNLEEDYVQATVHNQHVKSMTENFYTKARARMKTDRKSIELGLSVIDTHMDAMIYDLEVGDAMSDMYKLLYHPDVANAFRDAGRYELFEQMDMWYADVSRGDIGPNTAVERTLERIRTGVTVAKLGYNVVVAGFQPLGLLQAATYTGKRTMAMAALTMLRHPVQAVTAPRKLSGMMASRHRTYQKEIMEAQAWMQKSWTARNVPGGHLAMDMSFFMISAMQQVVDTVTWHAGFRRGMQIHKGNEALAIQEADRSVEFTQGSGTLGARTPLERGTSGKGRQQSAWTKTWMSFMSYFMAKLNVTRYRIGSTDKLNPFKFMNMMVDMFMVWTLESIAVAWLRGEGPNEDEGEGVVEWMGKQTGMTMASAIPIVKDVASMTKGVAGAGGSSAINIWTKEMATFAADLYDAGFNEDKELNMNKLFANASDAAGVAYRLPTTPISRYFRAKDKHDQGEDVQMWEWLAGPTREGK